MFKKVIVLFCLVSLVRCNKINNLVLIEDSLEYKLSEGVQYFTKCLEEFNDNNLGKSDWGRIIGYSNLKPNLEENGRGMKKMAMQMMPLVFHVGATSTWMLLTTIMAAKSVAIGLLLLVFKIAASTAKVASFFTLLKSKHNEHSWPVHGHERSLSNDEIHHEAWQSYNPDWHSSDPITGYKTIPTYKESQIPSHYDLSENEHEKSDKKYG